MGVGSNPTSDKFFKPLQVVQNKTLSIINSSDWYTRNCEIHDFKRYPERPSEKSYDKIEISDNIFIK